MAIEENNITKRVQKALSKIGTRLFRQNVGMAWTGKVIRGEGLTITLGPGDILLKNARPVEMGLIKGSSDLIGWHPVKITAAMVGRTIAAFVGFEVKTLNGIPTPEQLNWADVLTNAGGIGAVVRSEEDALQAVDKFLHPLLTVDSTVKG